MFLYGLKWKLFCINVVNFILKIWLGIVLGCIFLKCVVSLLLVLFGNMFVIFLIMDLGIGDCWSIGCMLVYCGMFGVFEVFMDCGVFIKVLFEFVWVGIVVVVVFVLVFVGFVLGKGVVIFCKFFVYVLLVGYVVCRVFKVFNDCWVIIWVLLVSFG